MAVAQTRSFEEIWQTVEDNHDFISAMAHYYARGLKAERVRTYEKEDDCNRLTRLARLCYT